MAENGAQIDDILGQLNPNYNNDEILRLLREISTNTHNASSNFASMSQSNARVSQSDPATHFRDAQKGGQQNGGKRKGPKGFIDSLEKQVWDGLLGSELKNGLNGLRDKLVKDLGGDISKIRDNLGQEAGKRIMDLFGQSSFGSNITSKIQSAGQGLLKNIIEAYDIGFNAQSAANAAKQAVNGGSNTVPNSNANTSDIDGNVGSVFSGFENVIREGSQGAANSINSLTEKITNGGQTASTAVSKFAGDVQGTVSKIPIIGNTLGKAMDGVPTIGQKLAGLGQNVAQTAQKIPGVGNTIASICTKLPAMGNAVMGVATKLPMIGPAVGALTPALGALTAGAGAAAGGIAAAAAPLLPIIAGAVLLFAVFKNRLGDTVKSFKELGSSVKEFRKELKAVGDRDKKSREEDVKAGTERLRADVKTMMEAPFEILKNAAEDVYKTWDDNLRKINGTQGYDKAGLSDLMASYADRIRAEGMTKVISSSNITENLAKVLDSGLSGQVAEEFAFVATKLGAAIPTQDFFGFASEYAAIAANQIKQGKSESQAIAYANSQLESFASNLLYAGRELAGGFSTGLKDANSLFAQSVHIANASKTTDVSQVSGVLTSVAAIVGATAPDLASSLMTSVEKALTGGNSSDLVALRSLAGINASNTEFLRQFSEDPQKVFKNLFSKLGEMQNMAPGADMEVAEGLASIFGINMDTLARVDFTYLAKAVSGMTVNNKSLEDNLKLLKSGETTANVEMLKMQQINEYLIDEGLAYVMDNETARVIQQHMWDEQMAREMREAEYGVNLQGKGLDILEAIRKVIDNILGFLNPIKGLSKLINKIGTIAEGEALKDDVGKLLKAGAVGSNLNAYKNLTTRGKDLNLTKNIVEIYGGRSAYAAASNVRQFGVGATNLFSPFSAIGASHVSSLSRAAGNLQNAFRSNKAPNSKYSWGTKREPSYVLPASGNIPNVGLSSLSMVSSDVGQMAATAQKSSRLTEMLNGVEKFIEGAKYDPATGKYSNSYEDWVKTARSSYGIADFKTAYENEGHTEDSLRALFEEAQTQQATKEKMKREQKEEDYWKGMVDLTTVTNTFLESIFTKIEKFHQDWVDYFVNHTVYSAAYDFSSVQKIKDEEKAESDTAIYALADALTQNANAMTDPQYQTNALLAAILKVTNAIMQQNNDVSNPSPFLNSLSGMAIGGVATNL